VTRAGRAWVGWAVALPALTFLLVFLVAPLAWLLVGNGGAAWGVWLDPYYVERLTWTVTQASVSTVLALAAGVPLAYLLARYDVPFGGALLRVLLLPFVTPTLVAAMGLTALFGPRGLVGVDLTESPVIVILGNLFFNLPLVVRLAHAGFTRVPASVTQAARTLGDTAWRAAARITLPLALPGVLAGAVLVFLYSALSFGLPFLLGGERYATLEVEVYTLTAYELKLREAGALVAVQIAVTAAAILLYVRLARAAGSGVSVRRNRPRPGWFAGAATALLALLTVLLCFGPLVAVAVRSFAGQDGFTLAYWHGLTDPQNDPSLALMLRNTLGFALTALAFAMLLGGLHALGAWRARSGVLDALSLLPLVVSPISLAVGYLVLFPRLRAELPLLIAAYTLLAAPLVTRSVLPALRSLPGSVLDAARTLGSSPARVWRTVAVPLVAPALRGGSALALASLLGEFAATLVLTRPEWATLSIGIAERLGRPGAQNLGEACALATVLMTLALAAFTLLDGGRGEVT